MCNVVLVFGQAHVAVKSPFVTSTPNDEAASTVSGPFLIPCCTGVSDWATLCEHSVLLLDASSGTRLRNVRSLGSHGAVLCSVCADGAESGKYPAVRLHGVRNTEGF